MSLVRDQERSNVCVCGGGGEGGFGSPPPGIEMYLQILPVSTLGNVKRIVWRIWILMLGCKGLK